MGNIQGKFADQNDIVVTGQVLTSNNNNSALNAAIIDANHLRATSVAFQPDGLVATLDNPVPSVTSVLTGTIGAALAGIGQAGTPSEDPGGGGGGNPPCFIADTQISIPEGTKPIQDIKLGDTVMGFDKAGKLIPQRVIGKQEHLAASYLLVEFEDGVTGSTPGHKYWTRPEYDAIANLESVWHWNHAWVMRKVIGKKIIRGEMVLYNLTVANTHNYIANGDAVSNLCPHEGEFG